MLKKAQTDIQQWDIAVEVSHISKTFIQWQRENKSGNIIKGLFKPDRKTITALDNVSFTLNQGEFVAYAGPNGAGKSTTMKLLSGILAPAVGKISVLGLSPQDHRIRLMNKLGVLFGNRTELWWDHPVLQSFEWKKVVWNIPDDVYRDNLNLVTELLDIGGLLKTFARELSLGQRMRADLAMMLLHSPILLLLDEPTLGLDVIAKRQMIDFLKMINREKNVTIIVTSHDMDDLEEMAGRILMISTGKLVYDGSFNGLRDITGNLSRVSVTMTNGNPPVIDGGTLLSSQNGVYDFAFDFAEVPVKKLMHGLSQLDDVQDVEIRKAPIEHVISELYKRWM